MTLERSGGVLVLISSNMILVSFDILILIVKPGLPPVCPALSELLSVGLLFNKVQVFLSLFYRRANVT